MNYEDLHLIIEEDNLPVNSELNIKIRDLFFDCLICTPKRIITEAMKDLIVKCFVIASLPNFNNRDYNYIESELTNAGWLMEGVTYQLCTSDSKHDGKWFITKAQVNKAIDAGRIGDVYSVHDIEGNIVSEFIPY